MTTATAVAHPNIALVKYWGKRDDALNLPAVPSLSLTLDRYHTRTTVRWGARRDRVVLDGEELRGRPATRVLEFLDLVQAGRPQVEVVSDNDFPTAAGLASSASGFAALALAASAAAGLALDPTRCSVLARRGSGSACRSLWGGWVEWRVGDRADGRDSHGAPLAPPDHWDVAMVVAVVSAAAKPVGSRAAMERSRRTSPCYAAWVAHADRDVDVARAAVLGRDLPRLGAVMEGSTFRMFATMFTASPPILYWHPGTIACVHAIRELRASGTGAWCTMDAGPNVKVLCEGGDAPTVARALREHVERVEIARPGPGARLVGR